MEIMKPKFKVLIYNFLGFALLFVIGRLLLGMFLTLDTFVLSVIAAIVASLMAPKFAVVKSANGEKIMMKWIMLKGFREF